MRLSDSAVVRTFQASAILFSGLAALGVWRHYSPIPIGDMWEGYINFFMRATDGDLSAWFAQHNEHRIILARFLFWIDLALFHGSIGLLLVFNYILCSLNVLLYWRILRQEIATQFQDDTGKVFALAMVPWIFLWAQVENLTWAFQSEFFLAQLLPLYALYLLHCSYKVHNSWKLFTAACAIGIASAGTMANGVLALPLMVLYALLLRQDKVKIAVLISLSMVIWLAYFYTYKAPPQHDHLSRAITEEPIIFCRYILLYLGNPFYRICGKSTLGSFAAYTTGIAFICGSAWAVFAIITKQSQTQSPYLIVYILYIVGTAVGTAGGRLSKGLDQAMSSRYTTPMIMAWSALAVLFAPRVLAFASRHKNGYYLLVGIFVLCMLPLQLQALRRPAEDLFQRRISQLALTLRVNDQRQLRNLAPNTNVLFDISQKASARNLSIFGLSPYRELRDQFGTKVPQGDRPKSQGSIDTTEGLDGEKRFVRVEGWMFDSRHNAAPKIIRFLNNQDTVVGYALTGSTKSDAVLTIGKHAQDTRFIGYVLADQLGKTLTLQGETPNCQTQAICPFPLFIVRDSAPERVTLNLASIINSENWNDRDKLKPINPNLQILSSRIHSDADISCISLHIRRGDKLEYRSGAASGRQTINLAGVTVVLPMTTSWVLLDFSMNAVPEQDCVATISDNGSDRGDWSAIAVKTNCSRTTNP